MGLSFGILQQNNPVWNGLQSYWNFNTGSGSVLYDIKGSINGTISNTSSWDADGIRSNCFEALTANDVDLGANYVYTAAQPYSISTWTKPLVGGAGTGIIALLSNFTTGSNASIDFYINNGNIYFILIYNNTSGRCYVNTNSLPISGTGWYNIVVTYGGDKNANNMRIYVNGGSNIAVVITNTLTYTGTLGSNLRINKRSTSQYNSGALIDEIGLWNRVLTEAESATIYNAGSGLFY